MSNPERGAYAPPTEAPLAFDARQPVRGRGPAPMMLIVSALVLIVLVVAIVVIYRAGASQAAGPPPTVGTPIGQIKGPPPAEAQPSDPAAGLQIYRSAEGQAAPAQPNFVAPPETPQARAPAAAPLPAAAPPPAATLRVETAPAPAGPVAAMPTATKPAAPATKLAEAPPAKPAVAPKTDTPPSPEAVGGVAMVQIGAFSSQALADKGWNDAARIAPGAAAGKGKKVEAIQKDGATLYRTAVTGFASHADAAAFCEKLKASGKGCFVK